MCNNNECNCGKIGVIVKKRKDAPSYADRPDLMNEPSKPLEFRCSECHRRMTDSLLALGREANEEGL
ncbi:MAG: hypothetical protein PF572_03485 [Patescibacteria group bacterium]|jgi:hypothetical protein|nr:hypothetical protein [Patescibacteria group bacterium]